ncbi:hypothetical protein CAPTEDRAFT_221017 [Capitella teleta]|uniref:Uncharacterized protein n=1 Tax=Capitella teleta TaxID=283909 RepID=R7V8Y7_CAPTE|nr:hypothetical protein CAPTEDRAFT_221017 [Capitella teleta]|eukprot:ELU15039.1 hypothetical protein CAPTEDRAFT_221017 [Capitella teleta]
MQSREKRYTDYQERASAFCTGLCMYEQRQSYSVCFDLCNWYAFRVRPNSPVARKIAIMRARQHSHPPTPTAPAPTTPNSDRKTALKGNYQQLLRIGIPANQVAKPTASSKSKNKNGRRKQKQFRRLRVKAKPKTAARKIQRTKNQNGNVKDEAYADILKRSVNPDWKTESTVDFLRISVSDAIFDDQLMSVAELEKAVTLHKKWKLITLN